MTQLLLLGATGLMGQLVLQQALVDPRVTQVVAPTQRALPPHSHLLNPLVDCKHLSPEAI